jgi:hypothetical protein
MIWAMWYGDSAMNEPIALRYTEMKSGGTFKPIPASP